MSYQLNEMTAIAVKNVSKKYPIYEKPLHRLQEAFVKNILGKRGKYHKEFWALRDMSFDVKKGSIVGIVGQNGAGKSTLLQIIAGTMTPTTGSVEVNGRVSALLELGAGFNPEFTGRENVFMNGSILGFSESEMKNRFDEIERFADIGEFIDQPVKTYSSGMYVRLAFAVAINVDPEILIVDEALSVGDVFFQHRCMHKINQFKRDGKTILFVSHDPNAVKSLCDKAILIDKGRMLEIGTPDKVVAKYLSLVSMRDIKTPVPSAEVLGTSARDKMTNTSPLATHHYVEHNIPNIDYRYGDKRAEIIGIAVYDAQGNKIESTAHGETILIRISAIIHEELDKPLIGFMFRNKNGVDITGTNTLLEGKPLPPAKKGQVCTVDFITSLPLLHGGNYSISPAVANGALDEYVICDWIENAYALQIFKAINEMYGLIKFLVRVEATISEVEEKTGLRLKED
ncbi:MAG TPA: ABC transporter ATP-binding protein [Candidatus Brocadiales bacterium]|nr:ABC transporter ATP-binding protein [Candidatus Brocadiales bacterium]